MDTNDILMELHAALVRKAKERIAIEGKAKVAAEIGNAVIEYGRLWAEGLANDGTLSTTECNAIADKFNTLVKAHVPPYSGSGVKYAWEGLTIFGLGWSGLKSKLKDWFKLDFGAIAAIASLALLGGCKALSGLCTHCGDF